MIPHNVMLLHASLPSNCRFRLVEVLVIFSNASVASSVNGDLMAAFDLSRNGNDNLTPPPPPHTDRQTRPPPKLSVLICNHYITEFQSWLNWIRWCPRRKSPNAPAKWLMKTHAKSDGKRWNDVVRPPAERFFLLV